MGRPVTTDQFETVMDALGNLKESLGEVKGTIVGIRDHLAAINGSVDKHRDRLNDLERHPNECPLKRRVYDMETLFAAHRSADQATAEENRRWVARIHPGVWLFIVLILGLFAGHSEIVGKIIGAAANK
jgi:hypothetical protein